MFAHHCQVSTDYLTRRRVFSLSSRALQSHGRNKLNQPWWYKVFIAAIGMSTGLEHIGGMPAPIVGVQAHFLEVVTSTVHDKGWVIVGAQGSKCIAGHRNSQGRSTETKGSLAALGNQSSIWQDHGIGQGSNGDMSLRDQHDFPCRACILL